MWKKVIDFPESGGLRSKVGSEMRTTERLTFDSEQVLENGTWVGMRGLSLNFEKDGTLTEKPQDGILIIDEDVSIGALCTIHRGGWRPTHIMKGCRIGSAVNLGHNTILHQNVMVAPKATIGGSCSIGEGAKIWQGAMIASRITVGKGSVIAMGAVVLENVPEGEIWGGTPAKRIGLV